MISVKYDWREGAVLAFKNSKKANVQKLGEAYEAAGRDDEKVHDAAADNPKHPFYKHLDWNDAERARRARIEDIRKIVSTITLVNMETGENEHRGFISLINGGKRARFTPEEIRTSSDLQNATLKAAWRDLEAFRVRYRGFTDICEDVYAAQQKVEARLAKTESRETAA